MNVDAAYSEDGSGAAAAAILWNSKGEAMMAGRSRVLKSLLNSTTAKAVALQRGAFYGTRSRMHRRLLWNLIVPSLFNHAMELSKCGHPTQTFWPIAFKWLIL